MKDELGNRMKEYYENRSKTYLVRRMPTIIRLDGKAFHSFTRKLNKPFDEILVSTMQQTMLKLCENIQGCIFGYTQSDEITLVLKDYAKLTSDAWFDYNVQKICSISASMATLYFNRFFKENVEQWLEDVKGSEFDFNADTYYEVLLKCIERGALFDSRCFNIPKEEVVNCILWRQQDATRNSIQSVGQAYFSHKKLMNKSCNDIQDMLFTEKGVNWNNYPTYLKRGSCCYKEEQGWELDLNMPVLKDEGRDFLERLVITTEE